MCMQVGPDWWVGCGLAQAQGAVERCLGEALGSVHQLQSPRYSAKHLLCLFLCELIRGHSAQQLSLWGRSGGQSKGPHAPTNMLASPGDRLPALANMLASPGVAPSKAEPLHLPHRRSLAEQPDPPGRGGGGGGGGRGGGGGGIGRASGGGESGGGGFHRLRCPRKVRNVAASMQTQ